MKSLNIYINEALIKKDTNLGLLDIEDKIKFCFKLNTYSDEKFVEQTKNIIGKWCEDDVRIEGPIVYQKEYGWFDEEALKRNNIKIKEIDDNDIHSNVYYDYVRKFKGVIYNKDDRDISFYYKDNTICLEHKRMFIIFIKL